MVGQECLLVKTASEIALKSNYVRKFFTKKLVQSIKFGLKRNKIGLKSVARAGGRLYLFPQKPKRAQKILSTISGIHAIALAQCFQGADYKEIEKQLLSFAKEFLKKGNSFALSVNTSNNSGFSRKDLENRLGAAVMEEIPNLKVNLSKPEKKVFLEVRKKDFFIYTEQQKGLGGLPLGVEGSVAFLFKGKKDELVAAFLLMHRGCNIFPVVKKKSPKLKKFLEKLIPFNDYRKFVLTEEKDLPVLLEGRKIKAIGTADSKLDEKSLAEYKKFNKGQKLVVLRPLLLLPEKKKKELVKKFK
jgi:thiamine biosynthesis protein ThiI